MALTRLGVCRRVRDEAGQGVVVPLGDGLTRCDFHALRSLLVVHLPRAAPLEVGAAVHGPRPEEDLILNFYCSHFDKSNLKLDF